MLAVPTKSPMLLPQDYNSMNMIQRDVAGFAPFVPNIVRIWMSNDNTPHLTISAGHHPQLMYNPDSYANWMRTFGQYPVTQNRIFQMPENLDESLSLYNSNRNSIVYPKGTQAWMQAIFANAGNDSGRAVLLESLQQ